MVEYHNIDNIAPEHFVNRIRTNIELIENVMAPKSSGYEPKVAEILNCSDSNKTSRKENGVNSRYWDIVDESDGRRYELKKSCGAIIFDTVRYAEILAAHLKIPDFEMDYEEAIKPTITVLFYTIKKRISEVFFIDSIRVLDLVGMTEPIAIFHLERFSTIKNTKGLAWNSQVSVSKTLAKKILLG